MDSSNAPQLTDAEAEAVTRALGPRLQWSPGYGNGFGSSSEKLKNPERLNGITTNGMYDVRFTPKLFGDSRDTCPRDFENENVAKLACERHWATGKWES